jgi:hypothetical protein
VANSTRGGNGARNATALAPTTYSDFKATHPLLFTEVGESLLADHWLWVMESKFELLRCTEVQKTLFAAQLLRNDASAWWANYTATRPADYQVSWAEFCNAFRTHYIPAGVIRKKSLEFMNLKQAGRKVRARLLQEVQPPGTVCARPNGHGRQEEGPLHDRSLHQAAGAHGARHWGDNSRVRQQCHDRG